MKSHEVLKALSLCEKYNLDVNVMRHTSVKFTQRIKNHLEPYSVPIGFWKLKHWSANQWICSLKRKSQNKTCAICFMRRKGTIANSFPEEQACLINSEEFWEQELDESSNYLGTRCKFNYTYFLELIDLISCLCYDYEK